RPSVCNAEEVLIVHEDISPEFLPRLEKILVDDRRAAGAIPVELRCDEKSLPYIKSGVAAGERDFDTEFLDYILAVKTVSSVDEAIEHILCHSTGHSDGIVTADGSAARRFTQSVDSAAVYVNASTRFTDGGEFGLGCEMGISTQKLHARGPMGLEELTSYKYIITGNGNVR
ncbi:MAG: aldehyde dehydrogenase family protein, partial [Clostridia bacterium]|nr:aldehyde dehydrogenase family protein [Clostridia bacterium]